MSDQVAWIKRINQHLITQIGDERFELIQQLDALRKQSEAIQKNLNVLDSKKDQILAAEKLQVDLLNSSTGFDLFFRTNEEIEAEQEETTISSGPVKELGKLKARVGEQRYLVLDVLRITGGTTIDFLTFRTGLPERRVRDAIVADQHLGVVEKNGVSNSLDEVFRLTDVGADLLTRFDEYRRQKGLPLPVLPQLPEVQNGNIEDNSQNEDNDMI